MSTKPARCDACNSRIRRTHHELVLTEPMTGQVVGHYHAGERKQDCQRVAVKYLVGGALLMATFVHPDRCGSNQDLCDGGLSEAVA
jgi:hypothetical protein